MINEILLKNVENIADEFGVKVTTLDKLVGETPVIDVDNNEVVVLTLQLDESADVMSARMDNLVSLLEDEDGEIALIQLLSSTIESRVLDVMPENTEVALMML